MAALPRRLTTGPACPARMSSDSPVNRQDDVVEGRALMATSVPCPSVPGDWADRPGTVDTREHPRAPCRAIRPQIIHLCAAMSDDRRALTTVPNGGYAH